jgi:hypothetical protein
VFCSGLYFVLSNRILGGTTLPNSRFGQGGGNSISLNGWGFILLGLAICAFPVFELIKRTIKRKP